MFKIQIVFLLSVFVQKFHFISRNYPIISYGEIAVQQLVHLN